jgi:superoxide dismutase, Fe-Mn family
MQQHITPIPCTPWLLNGLSDRLIVSHYENHYGAAGVSLDAIRDRLAELDLATAPAHIGRALRGGVRPGCAEL